MTYEEKIQWLGQYRAAVRREQLLEGELEMMRSAAQRVLRELEEVPGGKKSKAKPQPGEKP